MPPIRSEERDATKGDTSTAPRRGADRRRPGGSKDGTGRWSRKLLALFDRAAARDFVDIYTLSNEFDRDGLVDLAARLDDGFDSTGLIEMLASLSRYTDDEFADLGAEPVVLRAFAEQWRAHPAMAVHE